MAMDTTSISGTVSVYNSTSSNEAITIQIVGTVTNIFSLCFLVIQYRTQKRPTVDQYYQYNHNSSLYLEGKYCCEFTCCYRIPISLFPYYKKHTVHGMLL